jgi:hypothetical protein
MDLGREDRLFGTVDRRQMALMPDGGIDREPVLSLGNPKIYPVPIACRTDPGTSG